MLALAALVSSAPAPDEDQRAFDALLAEHLPGLRARALQLCRAHLDPDDLLQDALMRAFRARPLHISLDVAPDAEPFDDPTEPLPWQRIGPEELRVAIDQLPDDLRETYRLFALEGKDYAAIAAAVDIPKSTVGTRLLRARKKLRALLAAVAEDTP